MPKMFWGFLMIYVKLVARCLILNLFEFSGTLCFECNHPKINQSNI